MRVSRTWFEEGVHETVPELPKSGVAFRNPANMDGECVLAIKRKIVKKSLDDERRVIEKAVRLVFLEGNSGVLYVLGPVSRVLSWVIRRRGGVVRPFAHSLKTK